MITKQDAEHAYESLIQLRRKEVLKKDPAYPGQIEIHHILPISCGGKDEPENKIALYAKEHFMAHVYLWVIHHNDEFYRKCLYALYMMNYGSLNGSRQSIYEFIQQSEEYQKACEEYGKYVSINMRGENNGAYGRHWYKDINNLSCGMFDEGEQPAGWIRGHIQPKTEKTIAHLKMLSQATKGKIKIYNVSTLKTKYISKDEEIPDGYMLGTPRIPDEIRDKIRKKLKSYTTDNVEYRQKQYEYLQPLYARYCESGFAAMKEEFLYPHSQQNFVQQCKLYVPEFVPTRGKKRGNTKHKF